MTERGPVCRDKRLLEERLEKVKTELEAMAQLCPDRRDLNLWRKLISEESELMEKLPGRQKRSMPGSYKELPGSG